MVHNKCAITRLRTVPAEINTIVGHIRRFDERTDLLHVRRCLFGLYEIVWLVPPERLDSTQFGSAICAIDIYIFI